jgi:methionine synthase I (cobalamin-dependent)
LKKSLRAIERAFADIERHIDKIAKRARVAAREAARNAGRSGRRTGRWVGVLGKPRRPLKITPKRRVQLKLQGAYMGYMRQLKPAQKARVKAVKAKRGFDAAIRVARMLAR